MVSSPIRSIPERQTEPRETVGLDCLELFQLHTLSASRSHRGQQFVRGLSSRDTYASSIHNSSCGKKLGAVL
jgi:hypothetical protein